MNHPFLPIRAMRLILEFVPCVVVTKAEAGAIRVQAIGQSKSIGEAAIGTAASFPKSIKKKGDTIVGRIDVRERNGIKYVFAIWMGERHGWVMAPESGTDDHVLLSKISDDEFKVNCLYSHTVYTWDGSGFQATTIPRPSTTWNPIHIAIHDRNRLLDYFKCGPDTYLINMPPRSFALFNTKTGIMQEMMMSHTDLPAEFMFLMGSISQSQFLVSTYRDAYTYDPQPHNEHVSILTVSQDAFGNPLPTFSLLRTPLQVRRMRAAQTFRIHHLSDYNVFVGNSDGCTCLVTLHPADHLLNIHFQCSKSGMWTFDAHRIPLPDVEVDKIRVSHNRIHVLTDSWDSPGRILYSDFRLNPPGHSPFAPLENASLEPGILDVELCGGSDVLSWVLDEIEFIKERRMVDALV
jgi:hypothetical protein